jgi:hypothetical protein
MRSGASTRSSAAVPRRLVELTTSFANDWQAVFKNAQARRAVQRLIRRLQNADTLPLEGDPLSFVPSADAPPIARFGNSRRVPRHNLWLWYRERRGRLQLLALSRKPP